MTLLQGDERLFYAINHLPHPAWMDGFFGVFWSTKPWLYVIAVIGTWLIWRTRSVGARVFLIVLVSVGVSDWTMAKIIKPKVNRIRPCFSLPGVITPMGLPGGEKSFPSNHAANSAAVAAVIYFHWKKPGMYLLLLSFLVGFSRIYHGVHFPLDVVTGWTLGIIIATLCCSVADRALPSRRIP